MIDSGDNMNRLIGNFQRALTSQWVGTLKAAQEAKKPYQDLADQCFSFYAKDCGFMWKKDFKDKYLGSVELPEFQVTINKAFELVMIYGPYLMWECPFRKVQPYDPVRIEPSLFGDPQANPEQAQQLQWMMETQDYHHKLAKLRADLFQRLLNYLPREQQEPLKEESELAVIEALVKGRGCLWTETYTYPASGRKLVGSFFSSVDNLLIDPDCHDPALKSAKWIARRHVNNYADVERRFDLPAGVLKKFAQSESSGSMGARRTKRDQVERKQGKTHDQIIWYEIFSTAGIGTRQSGFDGKSQFHGSFEEVVGDYAYLCISPDVPWLLNAPPPKLADATDEDVQMMFAWPNPTYLDNRFPVALIDFNRNPESCWPIPPLAPAMGELIALNVLASAFLENAYENRRQIVAYLKSAAKDVQSALASAKGTAFVELNDNINQSINNVIQFLNKPGMNRDIVEAIRFVQELFDKRTGLVEFLYAQSSTQDRTARSVAAKEEKAGIRPEKMSRDVANWQTVVARNEMLLSAFVISGSDIQGLLGPVGAQLWDQYVAAMDPEEVVREMTATCEASDIRKPNKEREAQNMQALLGWLLPLLQQNAMVRGDQAGADAVNNFILSIGESIDQDTSGWLVQPFAPPPNPELQELQQQIQEMELAKSQADIQDKQASAAKKVAEAQAISNRPQEQGMALAEKAASARLELLKKAASIQMESERHQQKMRQDAISFLQKGIQMQQSRAVRQQSQEAAL